MSHGIDLVHFFMNETPPRSIVAHGGVFAWHDGRQNPDTFQALVEDPTFLVSYSTSFGNDCDSFSRIMGKKATLVNIGGKGSPRWKVVEAKGNHEDNPTIARAERWVTLPGDHKPGPINIGDEDLSNWFACMRSGNTNTNATLDNGFLHAAAVIWRRSRNGKANGCIAIQRPSRSWTAQHPTDDDRHSHRHGSKNGRSTSINLRSHSSSWFQLPKCSSLDFHIIPLRRRIVQTCLIAIAACGAARAQAPAPAPYC